MSKHLERDLSTLDVELLALSARAEEMIAKSCRSLWDPRAELVNEVVQAEELMNQAEVQIEEHCLKILALHQPVAVDLRRTSTVMKINADLERIADLAVNICERSVSLQTHPPFELPEALKSMVSHATSMVHESLNAFVGQDVELASDVCSRDETVNRLNLDVIRDLQLIMQNETALVPDALQIFSVSRHLERIADHATNIAEDVLYLVDGEIVRHRSLVPDESMHPSTNT